MNRYLVILSTAFLSCVLLASCADPQLKNQLRQTQEELRHLKEERAQREEKVESAYEDYDKLMRRFIEEGSKVNEIENDRDQLKRKYALLQVRYAALEERYHRLLAWGKDVAAGYGPGIWMWSEHDMPLFVKSADAPTVKGIIDELNLNYRRHNNPTLVLKEVKGRTVTVRVSDEMKLVSQMGSAGAAAYVQSATYSLASLDDIDCVVFDIIEGDHAGPGRFCPFKK